MNWNTIYITGNGNFWEEVNKKLSQSDLTYLNGFIEQLPDGKFQGLYWLDNQVDMRKFKEAVTGKVIWKYRLNFFNELEQEARLKAGNIKTQSFSSKENALISAMRKKSKSKPKRSVGA